MARSKAWHALMAEQDADKLAKQSPQAAPVSVPDAPVTESHTNFVDSKNWARIYRESQ